MTKNLTLYAYDNWSVRPVGMTTAADAKLSCRIELESDGRLDAVRAIDDAGNCHASIERDDDGQIVDLSALTA